MFGNQDTTSVPAWVLWRITYPGSNRKRMPFASMTSAATTGSMVRGQGSAPPPC